MSFRKYFCLALSFAALALSATVAFGAKDPHAEDRQAIQKTLDQWVEAWNKHDMRAMSDLFSEDADFTVITAKHLKGRKEIFEYHDELHKSGSTSQRKATWEDLRFVRPDVAIGHVYFEPPDPKVTGKGSRTALALVVMTREKGKWWIAALHNTLKYGPPLPEQSPGQ